MKKMKWIYALLAILLLTSCGTLMQPYQMDSKMKDIELGMTKKEVISILEKNDTVTQIYRVTGKSRLHVHAVSPSQEELEQLLHGTMDHLPGVLECSTNIILSRVKDIKGLRL